MRPERFAHAWLVPRWTTTLLGAAAPRWCRAPGSVRPRSPLHSRQTPCGASAGGASCASPLKRPHRQSAEMLLACARRHSQGNPRYPGEYRQSECACRLEAGKGQGAGRRIRTIGDDGGSFERTPDFMKDRAWHSSNLYHHGERPAAAHHRLALRVVPCHDTMNARQCHAASSVKIATARVQPAEAPRILCGKQLMVNPVGGTASRLCSFSRWQ